ncbi:MAG: DegQ family serine endoprotease [Alysiella sp.]|uniref:DegQ family serine endoprotease n=1 Tax=Alysiella sp. TaxID=1872483 RepID=UPI0026DCA581|nr:DegQ family serine endoprotease [Alysiella sp.]MDO4434227.1 DegQ family serine endoprotease [Alysiella sp.]
MYPHHIKLLVLSLMIALGVTSCSQNEKNNKLGKTPEKTEFVTEVKPPKSDGTVGMLLPDFTQLVAREGGAVVNIQAMGNGTSSHYSDDLSYDFFRRLFPNQPELGEEDHDANFGSGVIVSQDGYLLTNAHVVKNAANIKVMLNDKREYPAKLIGSDEKSDIAVLKIDAENLPVAKIGNANELKSGEWVAAIGAPFGFDNSVTAGIVSAKNRTLPGENYTPFIQTDVAINPGNSGGPLYNLKGEVVGINSQIYSRSGGFMGISFAIPIDVAVKVAEQLKTTGKVQRGQLGVVIQEVSYDLAQSFGLDKPIGALVARVVSGSPAEKAGLQVGDIIRSVNGEEVRSSSDLPMTIGALAPGEAIRLGIWRKGKEMETQVVLGSADAIQEMRQTDEAARYLNNNTHFEVPVAGLWLAMQENGLNQRLIVLRAEGAARRAGMRRGDVIIQVGNQQVVSQETFEQALQQSGKQVPILIERGNSTVYLALILP